jgi:hypothetical protein
MESDEETIDYLERLIPELAVIATSKAYFDALASGNSVVIAEEGKLIEVFPDGTRQIIKEIEPPVKVKKGIVKIK